jgi:hypothetical protein
MSRRSSLNSRGDCFKPYKAPAKVAHFGGAVVDPKGLPHADILLNGCVHERGINVKTTHIEIVSGSDALKKMRRLARRMTCEKVSVSSRPSRWLQPFATNRALYHETAPEASLLAL